MAGTATKTSISSNHVSSDNEDIGVYLNEVNKKLKEVVIEQERIQEEFILKSTLMEEDLRLAAEFQQAVLPPFPRVDYLNAKVLYQPCSVVSGDVYDFLMNREGEVSVFLGDATGHGVAAALMTMMVHIGLEGIRRDLPTDGYTRRLNKLIAARQTNRSVTSVFFRVKPNGELTVTHAGHPSLIIIPADGGRLVHFDKGGCPLGIFEEESLPYEEETYQLSSGDKVFAYTDAVTEWRNKDKEGFELERLLSFLDANRKDQLEVILDKLKQELERHADGEVCGDDLTVLMLEFLRHPGQGMSGTQ